MKSPRNAIGRRAVLAGLGGAFAAPAIVSAEAAYPSKPVRYINPFPAGGATDTLSRLFCAKMSELTGQQWLVENKGGSGGNVGMDALAQSAPDGYSLGLGGIASHAIAPTLYARLPFNPRMDFTFVSTIWQLPNMLVVNLDLPAKSVPELIELLRKNPGKYSYGSAGSGTTLHLSGELFKFMTGCDMLHVPFKGAGPALVELMSGQVHVIFDNLPSSAPHLKGGRIRALAVTSAEREPSLPGVPTVAETVPGYEATAWFGIGMPRGTPAEIIEKVNAETNRALADPQMQARLAQLGGNPIPGTPQDFGKVIAAETAKWAKVVISSGAKVE